MSRHYLQDGTVPGSDSPRIAAAYIRCSTDRQEDSPETQRHVINKWLERNAFVIPPQCWYIDYAQSAGKPIHQRPEGLKLLMSVADRKNRIFDAVIILSLDRAFRDAHDQLNTWAELDKYKVELLAAEEDLSRDSASKRAFLTMKAGWNQMEREIDGERIKRHNTVRHEKGLHSHGVPALGLRIGRTSKDPLEVVPDELPRIIRLFEIYAETCGNARETAYRLNMEGMKPRNVLAWSHQRVRFVVRNPQYRRMEYFAGDLREKLEIIPETVPQALVERVNDILVTQYGDWFRPRGKKAIGRQRSTYTALLSCGLCGNILDSSNRAKHGEGVIFSCRHASNKTHNCPLGSLHGGTIDELVGEAIRKHLEESLKPGDEVLISQQPKAAPRPNKASRIEAQKERRAFALRLLLKGAITESEFAEIAREVTDEIENVESEPEDSEPKILPLEVARDLCVRWDEIWFPDLYSHGKRELLTVFFGITRGGIQAHKERYMVGNTNWATIKIRINAPVLSPEPLTAERSRPKGRFRAKRADV